MISGHVEAGLVGGVLYGNDLAVGARVRVAALLHQTLGLVGALAEGLYVAALFRYDVVAGLVAVGQTERASDQLTD